MSGVMASMFSAVSSSVSPFTGDEDEPEMFTASADSRLAAISNEVRVRVDGSRNRLMTVFPRSVGTFLMGRAGGGRAGARARGGGGGRGRGGRRRGARRGRGRGRRRARRARGAARAG